jgi:hypothetical protein
MSQHSCGFGSYEDQRRARAGQADGEDPPGRTMRGMARQQNERGFSAARAASTVRLLSRAIDYLQGLVSDLGTTKLNLACPCKAGKTSGRQGRGATVGDEFRPAQESDLGIFQS